MNRARNGSAHSDADSKAGLGGSLKHQSFTWRSRQSLATDKQLSATMNQAGKRQVRQIGQEPRPEHYIHSIIWLMTMGDKAGLCAGVLMREWGTRCGQLQGVWEWQVSEMKGDVIDCKTTTKTNSCARDTRGNKWLLILKDRKAKAFFAKVQKRNKQEGDVTLLLSSRCSLPVLLSGRSPASLIWSHSHSGAIETLIKGCHRPNTWKGRPPSPGREKAKVSPSVSVQTVETLERDSLSSSSHTVRKGRASQCLSFYSATLWMDERLPYGGIVFFDRISAISENARRQKICIYLKKRFPPTEQSSRLSYVDF